ncbi:ribonuclease HII [Rhodovibrio salinarum]|uniref:Ribonuclease HII n=1 Tax=Rhodovibrio salinarum TaxID=1087 RepID=A0A934QHK1_9PROT|nr:ribonuclease HII [Rhodovibrio salinarum]MBK1696924.1 ribonuclease HII [Rhodovibrio salinarum]
MPAKPAPTFAFETAAGASPERLVVGVDEVGRGPLAGPVVACALALDPTRVPEVLIARLRDSKALSAKARTEIAEGLRVHAVHALGRAEVDEIDRLNILHAAMLAMTRAVAALPQVPAHALIDGNKVPDGLPCPAEAVVGGDGRVLSIAGASIVAKVARDREMAELDARHPGYGWAANAGYGTRQHRDALVRLGATMHHRRSFKPVQEVLKNAS